MTEAEFLTPLSILSENGVYRQAHLNQMDKNASPNRKFPKPAHFSPDPDGLSVHWDRFIQPHGVYHVIGLSYRFGKTEYKNPRDFRLFHFPVGWLRQLEGLVDVVHSPVFHGNPAPVGSPNNYAHASLIYPDDEEIRLKLSNYCQSNFDGCYRPVDFELLDSELNELRARLDQTSYHIIPESD